MYLLDSSVWIEVFKKGKPLHLEKVVELDEIVTCLLVVQEVLQGFKEEEAFRVAREAMYSFTIVDSPLTVEVYDHAIGLYRRARAKGLTIRSSVDCLIAASAIRHNLTLLHVDRDFPQLARISDLRERSVSR